jgi:polysaccharide export outer membrane protein
MVKAIWAVACTVVVVAGAPVLGGGCASTKSQMTDFSQMNVGEGPGPTLRRLTELQKDTGSQPAVSPPAQQASPVSPPAAVTTPKASLEKNPMKSDSAGSPSASFRPKSLDASSPKKNKNLPASAERYLSSLDSVSSSVPPGEKTAKEIPKATVTPKVPEKNPATPDSVASSSTAAAVEPPVSDARTEKNPIPPAPASTAVPPSETPMTFTKSVSQPTSATKIPPAVQAQSSSAGQAGSSASSQYRIGPEDVLTVSVWGDKELTMDVVVRPDGKISLPLVQDIQAEGLTASELADLIHQKLTPYIRDPNVSVIVKQINAPKYSIIGYVNKPGTYPMRGDVTLLQALSEAGGFTPFASPRKIKLVRNASGKKEIRVFNYYDMIDKADQGSVLLKPGDTIVVP